MNPVSPRRFQREARDKLEKLEAQITQHERHPGTEGVDIDEKEDGKEVELTEIRHGEDDARSSEEVFQDAMSPKALESLAAFQKVSEPHVKCKLFLCLCVSAHSSIVALAPEGGLIFFSVRRALMLCTWCRGMIS